MCPTVSRRAPSADLGRVTHRDQDMARLHRAAGTCRTRRRRLPRSSSSRTSSASLSTPSITRWQWPGTLSCPGAVSCAAGMLANRPAISLSRNRPGSLAGARPVLARCLQGGSHADYAGDVVSASAALPFLRAAINERLERDRPTKGQSADTLRPAELVGANADHVCVPRPTGPRRARAAPVRRRCAARHLGRAGAPGAPPRKGVARCPLRC